VRVDQVNAVGPAGISLFGGVAKLVEHSRKFYPKFSHASSGDECSILFGFRAGKNNAVFDVALHLPDIAGVRFGNVNHLEADAIAILLVKFIQGGNLPPERRSSVAAKYQHDGLLLIQYRKPNALAFVQLE